MTWIIWSEESETFLSMLLHALNITRVMNWSADETYAEQQIGLIGLTLYFTNNTGKISSSFIWYFSCVLNPCHYFRNMIHLHASTLNYELKYKFNFNLHPNFTHIFLQDASLIVLLQHVRNFLPELSPDSPFNYDCTSFTYIQEVSTCTHVRTRAHTHTHPRIHINTDQIYFFLQAYTMENIIILNIKYFVQVLRSCGLYTFYCKCLKVEKIVDVT
jgi:hypothetical protein